MRSRWIVMAAVAVLLAGCESKDNANGETPEVVNEQQLKIGEERAIQAGQELVPTSDDARVKLLFQVEDNSSTVTLLQGQAKIVVP